MRKKKIFLLFLSVILIAIILSVSFSLALDAPSTPHSSFVFPGPAVKVAANETQFALNVAYAYVGPAPSNASYFDKGYNATMYLTSQYPSLVYLNFTRVPGVQIASCDAEMEVYGIKIAANTGAAEYYAYSAGTNFNSSFQNSDKVTMTRYVDNLVNISLYSTVAGTFDFNWSSNASDLSIAIGSIGWYSTHPGVVGKLASLGTPSAISVTVYRIGYITISNGLVSIYEDPATNNAVYVKLANYDQGFLYNHLVPTPELPNTNLFQPNH